MQITKPLHVITFAGILCFGAPAVWAAGGGGGGGSFSGGTSAPDPNVAFRKGIEYLQQEKCGRAEKEFKKVLGAVPRNAEANYYRAVAHSCQEEHKMAAKYYEKAAKYNATMYNAYHRAGLSHLALGKRDKAQEQLDKLNSLQAACGTACDTELLEAIAGLNAALNPAATNPEATEPAGEQSSLLFDRHTDPEQSYLSAVALINQGRFKAAIAELRQMTAQIGPHPDVMNYLGYAHRKLGQFAVAEGYYQQALALDPLHRGANEYLGELYVQTGQLGKARDRLHILAQACPFGCLEYEDLKRQIDASFVAAE